MGELPRRRGYAAPITREGTAPTVAELLASVTDRLDGAGVDSPRVDARWLVRHVLGMTAAELVSASARRVDPDRLAVLEALTERRARREPLQLVVGGTEFRGHRLAVRPGVFIPRPETELLVEHALAHLPEAGVVVEPCTGGGAVACAIAVERPRSRVLATDTSPTAVALASDNAASLDASVDVRVGHLLDPVPRELRGHVDVIVANPPYLAVRELDELPEEVAAWDPVAALVAGYGGHEVSDELFALAAVWLRPGGWLVIELDERRVHDAAHRAATVGLTAVDALVDLAGRPRFVRARRP